jgi:hypothetical protein
MKDHMETKDISQLNKNPKNPRRISKDDFEALKKAMRKYGDLGGIVFNLNTQQLVGGHQRTEAFKALGAAVHIDITERLEQPDRQGTMAYGYVILDGTKFSYREVNWTENDELSANIAANRISGEFDLELLHQSNMQLEADPNGAELLALTGQSEAERKRLASSFGPDDPEDHPDDPNDDGTKPMELRFTETQLSKVLEAIGEMKRTRNLTSEPNRDLDGNAVYYIALAYLESQMASDAAAQATT